MTITIISTVCSSPQCCRLSREILLTTRALYANYDLLYTEDASDNASVTNPMTTQHVATSRVISGNTSPLDEVRVTPVTPAPASTCPDVHTPAPRLLRRSVTRRHRSAPEECMKPLLLSRFNPHPSTPRSINRNRQCTQGSTAARVRRLSQCTIDWTVHQSMPN